ncbi:TetR/AcrR family transcriptional regulator [Streptomyces sp. NBC_01235]|uniref:TetR/AcrR family transcriptional regulator n=1 Tax=Streptomyces sp. NBC_01235 TaxID=2903788 RepID=UPI003FA38808
MGRTSGAREEILDGAQALIGLRGHSAPGVARICKTAGVPKGGFSYFFESKAGCTRQEAGSEHPRISPTRAAPSRQSLR